MGYGNSTRRLFLKQGSFGLSGILLASMLPETIFATHRAAKNAAANGEKLSFFSDAEAADLNAFAAQVIPGGDSPGAKEANVVYFIDQVLTKFQPDDKSHYRQALRSLTNFTARLYPSATSFAALENDQQIAVIQAFEKDASESSVPAIGFPLLAPAPSFELLRQAVVAGFLSDPMHGGNKNKVGWQCIGFDANDMHEPPFGYYDAERSKSDAGGDR